MTVFVDGFGRQRHAQAGACSFEEIEDVLWSALELEHPSVVLLSHNFELLKHNSSERDAIVLSRFERLCRLLATHQRDFPLQGFSTWPRVQRPEDIPRANAARLSSTARRYAEQVLRRVL